MQCDTCGLLLESIDDTQLIKGGRFSQPHVFCDRHKPVEVIYS